jgi:recombinational DNA repair protein RecR
MAKKLKRTKFPKNVHRCCDCGKPTPDHRCPACWDKLRRAGGYATDRNYFADSICILQPD